MTDTCETVKVVADNEQGFKIINLSDKTDKDVVYNPDVKKPVVKAKGK